MQIKFGYSQDFIVEHLSLSILLVLALFFGFWG